jgi:hypothetical protein
MVLLSLLVTPPLWKAKKSPAADALQITKKARCKARRPPGNASKNTSKKDLLQVKRIWETKLDKKIQKEATETILATC